MPLHPEVVSLLALMEAVGAPSAEEQGPVEARAARRALLRPPTEDCFEILDIDAGGVPARMYRAAPGLSPPGLLVNGFFSMPEFLSDARVAHAIAAEALLAVLR